MTDRAHKMRGARAHLVGVAKSNERRCETRAEPRQHHVRLARDAGDLSRMARAVGSVDEHRVRAVDNMPVGSDLPNSIDDQAETRARACSTDCRADL